jgi:hypothetical protein
MKKKMKLSPLKIQSFVTELDRENKKKIKGGTVYTILTCGNCPTNDTCICSDTCPIGCGTIEPCDTDTNQTVCSPCT